MTLHRWCASRSSLLSLLRFDASALSKTANNLELGTLVLSGEGAHTLELGPTATMSFADSSVKMWSGPLIIKGFHERAVSFSTNSVALSLITAEADQAL